LKDVFEMEERKLTEETPYSGMDFSEALKMLKSGAKMRRIEWSEIQWVVIMPPLYLPPHCSILDGPKVNDRTAKHIGNDVALDSQAYFACFTRYNKWQPGWMPSVVDLMATDWQIVED